MTKTRAQYIYQFQGTIQHRKLTKASPHSKYAGNCFYNLTIIQENQPRKTIQVFADKLVQPHIWATIESGDCFQQKYRFSCRNSRGYYYLVNWEEIK